MVHALKEIWRVLIPGQNLIDLRPLTGQSRVEVIADNQVWFAGLVDDTEDKLDTMAADRSVAQMVNEGWFRQVRQAFFDYSVYWDSPDEMKAYAETCWTKSRLPKAVLAQTRQFVAGSNGSARVRIRRKLMIARYQKFV